MRLPPGSSPEDLSTVLNKFHTARDKHILPLVVCRMEASLFLNYFTSVLETMPKEMYPRGQVKALGKVERTEVR